MMRMRYAPRNSPQKGMWASLLARRRPPQPRPGGFEARLGFRPGTVAAIGATDATPQGFRVSPPGPLKVDNRQLQTGTGTVQSAAITAVIFSLVNRSMVSSQHDANSAAPLYAASRAYAVTVITRRPPASRRRSAVGRQPAQLEAGGDLRRGCLGGRRPLVDFGDRWFLRRTIYRALRQRGWLRGRVELPQRCAQRIEARGVGKSVVFDGAPDCRCYRGELVVGEVNCRHGEVLHARGLLSFGCRVQKLR